MLKKRLKNIIRNTRFNLTRNLNRFISPFDEWNKSILIIAPHPDDEVIGCGGLISKLCNKGVPPHIVILTKGEASHNGCCSIDREELGNKRMELSYKANSILKLPPEKIFFLNYRDGLIPKHETNGELERYIKKIKPEIIFIPHWGERWPDHINVLTLITDFLEKKIVIYEYCIWSWYYVMWAGNYSLNSLSWNTARVLKLNNIERQNKKIAMTAYLTPVSACGRPYSGVLPDQLIKSGNSRYELYFRLK